MTEQELKMRTKQFGLRVIKLVNSLPRSQMGKVIGNQLLRSGTSVRANYRSACRAKSTADFIAKLGIVIEEADESLYWMELISDSGLIKPSLMKDILKEANELTASIKTTKKKSNPKSKF
jgi:four helix bundle protein